MKNVSFISKFSLKLDGMDHPFRDWYLILAGTLLLLAVSACWNIWIFEQLASGKSLGGAIQQEAPQQGIQVTDVQDVFKSRATERLHYQNDYQFVDPSVPGS